MSFATEKIPGTPIYKSRTVQAAQGVITLAQLNAGFVIPGFESRTTQLLGFRFKMNGTFAGLTDMRLQTTEAPTPTDLVTIVAANMGDTIVHTETAGTNVKSAAFWLPLKRGTNLRVAKTGAAATGGTSIDYVISYLFDS